VQGRRGRQSRPPLHLPHARGHIHPPFFCHPTSGALISLPLLKRLRGHARSMSHLLPYGIHEWVGMTTLKTLRKIVTIVKR
jgi:hypothetical protein